MQITVEYIKNHINNTTCIIVINNNVTNYLSKHPGGKQILMQLNCLDATVEFNNIQHFDYAKNYYKIKTKIFNKEIESILLKMNISKKINVYVGGK